MVFLQKMEIWKMSQFIFIEKPMQNWRFCNSEISKIAKTLIFQWFFATNEKFYKFTSRWSEKKIFRDGSDGSKNEFKTLLSNAAIKKYGCLMNFLHFWSFHFFHFLVTQKMLKITFSKNAIFLIFFPQISLILLIFH